jgi:hypothetical protein
MKRFFRNMILVFFGVSLALGFFELLPDNLLWGGLWEGPYCVYNPLTGYRFLPGELVCSKLFDFRTLLKIGKDGFRCTLPLDRSSDVSVRIILLGMSQPFSAGCDEPDSLHQRLMQILYDTYQLKSVCYNLSLPNSGILTQLDVLRKYAPVLHPTHVFYWGPPSDTYAKREEWNETFRERIIFGFNFPAFPIMRKSPLIKYSRLIRYLSAESLWRAASEKRHIPKALYDLTDSLGLVEAKTKHTEPVKDSFEDIRGDVNVHSYKEIGAYCTSIGAHFMVSIWPPDMSWVYPTDIHMTPAGIKQLANGLAANIARSIQ